MDSEFMKLLSQMAESELPEGSYTADKLEHYLLDEQLKQNYEQDTDAATTDIQMPAYLREQIITRSKQPDMQVVASPKRFPKRVELFLYSCKVTAAVAASLVIMVTAAITQNQLNSLPQRDDYCTSQMKTTETDIPDTIMRHLSNSSQYINGLLQNFSSNIMNGKDMENKNMKH